MTLRARSPALDFATPPRDWLGGNLWASHIANGVNLLFPAGERFFVRSVSHYTDRMSSAVSSAVSSADLRGFFAQEGSHAREHERFFSVLEAQGYVIRPFLALYQRIAYGIIEKLASPALRLATTAACEHYTAILAEGALRTGVLDLAPAALRALLLWHAAEEIEHRAVAYDVLQAVNPSYGLRVGGFLLASACLGSFWTAGTVVLLAQEKNWRRVYRDFRRARQAPSVRENFLGGARQYLERGFHPKQNPIDALAADYLASAGLTPLRNE